MEAVPVKRKKLSLDEEVESLDPFRGRVGTLLTEDEARSLDDGAPTALDRSEALSWTEYNVSVPLASLKLPTATGVGHIHKGLKSHAKADSLGVLSADLFRIIASYTDVFFPRRVDRMEELRRIYCLHALNHCLQTRKAVLKDNTKLTELRQTPDWSPESEERFRDQAFTRPKVLILVPFRHSALKVIQTMISLMFGSRKNSSQDKVYVTQKKRFFMEFGEEATVDARGPEKPGDYQQLFRGNTDDCFRIGVGIAKKSLKLYVEFYKADILVASPLGLRTAIGSDGEKSYEYDFLSSIELLIMDQAHVFLMQNWQHVLHLLRHLNLQTRETRDTDFSRVRLWNLNGWARHYRQTLLFADLSSPELRAVFTKFCRNWAGVARFPATYPSLGSAGAIAQPIAQAFHRFTVPGGLADQAEHRFNFFLNKILPHFLESNLGHVLIFVSSYFDFVRLRNHFKRENVSFVQICEYSTNKKVSRARDLFFHGKKQFLLFSERFHFYRRYRLRGIHHLLFYQLPLYPHFYPELINMIDSDAALSTVAAIFTAFDGQRLRPVLGDQKARLMLDSDKSVHTLLPE